MTRKFPLQAKFVYVVYKFVNYASRLHFHGPIKWEEQSLPYWLDLQEAVKLLHCIHQNTIFCQSIQQMHNP
jgi:hypothetical protein